ncbi:MAG: DUF2490 domain-containing protein [Flavobacteriaceae bacterium]|nr:MAG: DUF2490 domain-containing protein [Flavobacteriaceae bacterium]
MSIFSIKKICFLGFFLVSASQVAQSDFELLHEPTFLINHGFSENYRANFGLTARHFMYRDNEIFFKNRQVQVSHFSTFTLSYDQSLSMGIMFRESNLFDDQANNEIRLTQQYNLTKRTFGIRFGHRIMNEQRLFRRNTTYRIRYRLALDSPLQGEKLDIGEAYIVVNTEFLLSLNKRSNPAMDNRITTQIGWQKSEVLKLQVGLQYRFDDLNQDIQHKLLLLTSAILKI